MPLVEKYTREKNIRFKQGFGMTEFGPGIFALAPEDAIRKAGSYEEVVMTDTAHFPYVEKPDEFIAHFTKVLK